MKYLFGQGFQKDRSCFTNRKPMEQAFVGEFRELLRHLEEDKPNRAPQPSGLLRLMILFNPVFTNFQQADAAECINTMLQVLHTALSVNVKFINNPGSGQSAEIDLQRLGNTRYQRHVETSGYSIVEEAFGSQFLSRLECQQCGHISHAHDAYTVVPVPIPERALSLYDCFDSFSEPEIVTELRCENCVQLAAREGRTEPLGTGKKTLTFWSLPRVFVVHLKRFDHNLRKIEKYVHAPMVLNMTRYITHPRVLKRIQHDPQALQLYNLKGIICHSGQLNGGHYTSKCFREGEGWYSFNDANAHPIHSEESLQSPLNYVFFYEMHESTRKFWPR
jgi:ubiquitin C-terminal hydrolase